MSASVRFRFIQAASAVDHPNLNVRNGSSLKAPSVSKGSTCGGCRHARGGCGCSLAYAAAAVPLTFRIQGMSEVQRSSSINWMPATVSFRHMTSPDGTLRPSM